MDTQTTKIIVQTFQEISDIVTKTMGAKGRLAIIQDEFSHPFLTDDGVTVAKECMNQADPFKKMVALSMVEAAHNTERVAFDGTTLTVLLTNEIYKAGLDLIRKGMHPQMAANLIEDESKKALEALKKDRIFIKQGSTDRFIKDVAVITTKIPEIGDIVYEAYQHAGPSMNVLIEHDRKNPTTSIEHVDGMVIDSGYFSEELKQLCGEDGRFVANDAHIVLLSQGTLTPNGFTSLFSSIHDNNPLIFCLSKDFEPEVLHKLMTTLVDNKLQFMFIFINDAKPEEVFLDIAAKTGGKIQSSALGTNDYSLEFAGVADTIIIEQDKTTIIAKGDPEAISFRLAQYKKELDDNKYSTGFIRYDVITRRMSSLDRGITKIKLAASTITEFRTIRFKLDDAIGAVRCACSEGVLLGGGKALYNASINSKAITKALRMPLRTIITNAGYKVPSKNKLKNKYTGLDVNTGSLVNLCDKGIIDGYTSITQALINATSIATSYLRAYILITK